MAYFSQMKRAFLSFFLLSLLVFGCAPEPDLLVGRWQVVSINRGGDVIGGPGFTGTIFTFGADGTVKSEIKEDRMEVRYRREGDALVYQGEGMEERYRIDSLSETMLIIFSDADGIPTTTGMKRLDVGK